jgi:hypothetical protein
MREAEKWRFPPAWTIVANKTEERRMKRTTWLVLLLLVFIVPANGQMGMDLFRRPAITKAIHPVVGKGAQYQTVNKDNADKPTMMELGVISKESVDGKDAYWMQFANIRDGKTTVGKALVTPDDFQFHRMIMEIPGQGAMEMPVNQSARSKADLNDRMNEWHSAGSDTITVPAGTFSCEHWRNDKDGSDIWTSDKVTPFGMVKELRPNSTTVLVKVLDSVPDRIAGPVKKFDMQQMMQQMQQHRQQDNQ